MKGQRQEVWGETGISREVAELGAGGGGEGGMDIFWVTIYFFILEIVLDTKTFYMTVLCYITEIHYPFLKIFQ